MLDHVLYHYTLYTNTYTQARHRCWVRRLSQINSFEGGGGGIRIFFLPRVTDSLPVVCHLKSFFVFISYILCAGREGAE